MAGYRVQGVGKVLTDQIRVFPYTLYRIPYT